MVTALNTGAANNNDDCLIETGPAAAGQADAGVLAAPMARLFFGTKKSRGGQSMPPLRVLSEDIPYRFRFEIQIQLGAVLEQLGNFGKHEGFKEEG